MRICSCALSSPARACGGWRFAENFRCCWSHYWDASMVGDDEGEATITSSTTAKIRMLYSSIRNKGLLYFAIGIWDAMYLHHAPERAGGRLIRCFAKKMWSSWEPMEEVHAVGSFACRCIMAISVQSAILRHTESIVSCGTCFHF